MNEEAAAQILFDVIDGWKGDANFIGAKLIYAPIRVSKTLGAFDIMSLVRTGRIVGYDLVGNEEESPIFNGLFGGLIIRRDETSLLLQAGETTKFSEVDSSVMKSLPKPKKNNTN